MPHPDAGVFFEFILQAVNDSGVDRPDGTGQEDGFTALGPADTREKKTQTDP
jgi:hypothetical protein